MKRALTVTLVASVLCLAPWPAAGADPPPPIPCRIGGRLFLSDGNMPTPLRFDAARWRIRIAGPDGGGPIVEARVASDGEFLIDIPLRNRNPSLEGFSPGDRVRFAVSRNGTAVPVLVPGRGELIVGNMGAARRVDLLVDDHPVDMGSTFYVRTP